MDKKFDKNIAELIESSRQVIMDCALPNGAIVAADSEKKYYPKDAKYYRFVWPRDAFYVCVAAKILGLDIQENFFSWCMRAEGWKKTGLFYEKYFPNGKKARHNFQPDQTGSVLIALYEHFKDNTKKSRKFKKLIIGCADGLCRIWNKDHFIIPTQDLWEERFCFPDLNDNFTYSLAICSKGLECADKLIQNDAWKQVAAEMKDVLDKKFNDYFFRSFGKIDDARIDASLLGLVWPAEYVRADDYRMKKTVELIEKKITKDLGVYRYENDDYDGWMYEDKNRKKGAGYWPLLTFWMSIFYAKNENKKKALEYYFKVLGDIDGKKHIPEQIFKNNIQVAVSPLCWSHCMFILASRELGFL